MTNQTIIEDLTLIPAPPWWENPWIWLAAIGIAIGLYFLWKHFRRTVMVKPSFPQTPKTPAHEDALRMLAALKARHAQMTAYEVSIECSEILRHYLELRFLQPVRYQTTREFLEEARTKLQDDWRAQLEEFLHFFDGVKFARKTASGDQSLAAIEGCEGFVRISSSETAPTQKP